MSIGIYKPGQGYWVRVLTAVFAGILVLAAAAWAWQESAAVPLPTPTWQLTVTTNSTSLPEGSPVELWDADPDRTPEAALVGSATSVELVPIGQNRSMVTVTGVTLEPEKAATEAKYVRSGTGADAFVARTVEQGVRGVPMFERIYLQAAAAGVILLLGAIVVYWFCALKKSTVDFLIATDGEMKKVNWSTRREVIGSTIVVVVASFLIAALIFAIDTGFGAFFKWVDVIQ